MRKSVALTLETNESDQVLMKDNGTFHRQLRMRMFSEKQKLVTARKITEINVQKSICCLQAQAELLILSCKRIRTEMVHMDVWYIFTIILFLYHTASICLRENSGQTMVWAKRVTELSVISSCCGVWLIHLIVNYKIGRSLTSREWSRTQIQGCCADKKHPCLLKAAGLHSLPLDIQSHIMVWSCWCLGWRAGQTHQFVCVQMISWYFQALQASVPWNQVFIRRPMLVITCLWVIK